MSEQRVAGTDRDWVRELKRQVDLAERQEPLTDRDATRAIEARSDAHEAARLQTMGAKGLAPSADKPSAADVATAGRWAAVDARDFERLRDPGSLQDAAVAMAHNGRTSPAYAQALPPPIANAVRELDTANQRLVEARDALKAQEFAEDRAAKLDRARGWTADQAAAQAALDLRQLRATVERDERDMLGGDMARAAMVNPAYARALASAREPVHEVEEDRRRTLLRTAEQVGHDKQAPEAERNSIEPATALAAGGPGTQQRGAGDASYVSHPPLPPEVAGRFQRVGDAYFERDKPAFEDRGTKLETRSDSQQMAATLVAVAQARGWDEIKVTGSESFKRNVWVEAAARGVEVKGYMPNDQDRAEAARRGAEREREEGAALARRELAKTFAEKPPEESVKLHPQLAGAAAIAAAVDRHASDSGLTDAQRAVVTARVRQNLAHSIEVDGPPTVQVRSDRQAQPTRDAEREAAR